MKTKTQCVLCGRSRGACSCDDSCPRCLYPTTQCKCEQSLRPELYQDQEERFEMDEDIAYELEREYPNKEKSTAYWHGYGAVRTLGRLRLIKCPYQDPDTRKEFYEGVSDARHRS